ncbi:hypothetical protein A2W54_03905 [Candidatus Giovannonibacteria bacterium RIFCSPHIGHO2_02_43_13]|uniref:Uncharacterized protein n=1 Tax=Candidatus Giovannonibacteria bacterium RIFCSPHIGHO2_02_43_13 TaxID=1798330 RepID=A0A1F5WRG7_9BACT|nr:MAG: hypothetical protein UW28_C0013G0043 [Parcubacteria group bacterium GW2011_GWA2_44_13]OGF74665.1 MAG: hypothetical protein A3E06_03015 [Candidatus Giovannonibacteria bacterium RIFCSPHIGHO2_12_FULL_44_42]OGF78220.1 MAG: hypothetical protein A2W54_03905 [Candidatus Giovannonibacteria bacterium RIFCSPHIGHO2_02_43_13]OGF90086.1 MAG: hypothetical protein A3I94_03120 [Candidatus Giovannonibacteria bacterium RIFCSPLOWO2_02_FULL_43_54]OGF96627.1 MAG: hypothetical protein A3H08_01660 [Candidatus
MSEKCGWELETLSELCSLWRSGAHGYSLEFLADTICTNLARQRRFGGDEVGVKVALELLSSDLSLAESALEDILAKELFKAVLGFVKKIRRNGLERYDDCDKLYDVASEGNHLLCDYDSFHLLLKTLSDASLPQSGREKLAKEKAWFSLTTRLLERYFYVFWSASLMADGYCRHWKVESNNPLSLMKHIVELPEGTSYEEFKRSL